MTRHTLLLTLALACCTAGLANSTRADSACETLWVTGYVETGNPTASGLSTAGQAWAIAAAHPRFPLGTTITLDGIGPVSIQDRGRLGYSQIDVLVPTVRDAYALTGYYQGCW